MPSPLNLVSQAVAPQQTSRVLSGVVSSRQPAPASFTDPLYVVIPQWNSDHYVTITDWPACHGSTLPAQGAPVTLVKDDRGNLRCVWWQGPTTTTSGAGDGVTPETYGPTSQGDWGPAITQAWADALATNTFVRLSARTYGVATTVQPPALQPGQSLPDIVGVTNTVLAKLADVTLLNYSGPGTNLAEPISGGRLVNIAFNGGNNTSWVAPLVTFFNVNIINTYNLWFYENYGPAATWRAVWDYHAFDTNVMFCGATDGSNPAILLFSEAGDGINATNNIYFSGLRVEACRTGYLWAIGASSADAVREIVLAGASKFEGSQGESYWAPLIKLNYVNAFKIGGFCQLTNGGPAPSPNPQASPVSGALINAANSDFLSIGGEILASLGGTAAGATTSLFAFDGCGGPIRLGTIHVNPGDATSQPSEIFEWDGWNYNVSRGELAIFGAYWPDVTIDGGSTGDPYILDDLPQVAGPSDADYQSATGFLPNDGRRAMDTTNGQEIVRVNGAWQPVAGHQLLPAFIGGGDYTVPQNIGIVHYYSLTAPVTVTLPSAASVPAGSHITIKDGTGSAGTYNITIAPPSGSGQTIDGAATAVINTNNGFVRVYSDTHNWWRF